MLSIVNLALAYAFRSYPDLQNLLDAMNGVFSGIFIVDFLYRFFTAPAKRAYFFRDFGWADLLASVPLAELKFLRIFRLARVYRLLRALGGREVARSLVRDRAGSALLTLLLMGILVLQFGSLEILYLEQDAPGANITSASDALWYTIVTISTVGYGDQFPVTNAGRIMGAVIIVIGVGIFGTFTGYLANFFLAPRKAAHEQREAPSAESERTTEVPAHEPDTALEELRELVARPNVSLDDVARMLSRRRGDAGTEGGPRSG